MNTARFAFEWISTSWKCTTGFCFNLSHLISILCERSNQAHLIYVISHIELRGKLEIKVIQAWFCILHSILNDKDSNWTIYIVSKVSCAAGICTRNNALGFSNPRSFWDQRIFKLDHDTPDNIFPSIGALVTSGNPTLNSHEMHMMYYSVTQPLLWNFAQSTVATFSCYVQSFKTIVRLHNKWWTNESS